MDRFWSKVNKNGPLIIDTPCWEWTASCDHSGYGQLTVKCRCKKSHRVAYEALIGPIPTGVLACHKCDNPKCCNPAHIFLGTDMDNKLDSMKKGRHYKVGGIPPIFFGEKHPNHKLTEQAVIEIKKVYTGKYGEQTALGRKYGVDRSTIALVVKGRNWKGVG